MLPQKGLSIQVAVHEEHSQFFLGRVLHLSLKGTVAMFKKGASPSFPPGRRVGLTFTSPVDDGLITSTGTVGKYGDVGDGLSCFSFLFERNQLGVQALVTQATTIARKQPKAPPCPGGRSVGITVLVSRGVASQISDIPQRLIDPCGDLRVRGDIADLSPQGLDVLISSEDERAFIVTDRVEMLLEFPGQTDALHVAGRIRSRQVRDSLLCYGVAFDPQRTADFQAARRIIDEYLERPQ